MWRSFRKIDSRRFGGKKKPAGTPLKPFQSLDVWKESCDELLRSPFPPKSSKVSENDLSRGNLLNLQNLSNWELVCQEILDTKFSNMYYQRCYEELLSRGKTKQEILEMRRFAWYTAGWLNYAMMLWDWASLGEYDIRMAINWLNKYKQISEEERVEFENFVSLHE